MMSNSKIAKTGSILTVAPLSCTTQQRASKPKKGSCGSTC